MKNRIAILAGILCLCASSYAATYKENKTICEGQSHTFRASDTSADDYFWYEIVNGIEDEIESARGQSSYTTNQPGEYKCKIVTNGDDMDTGNLLTEGTFDKNCNNYPNYQKVKNALGHDVEYQLHNKVCPPNSYPSNAFTTIAATPKDVKRDYFKNIRSASGTNSNILVCDGDNSGQNKIWYARELQLQAGVTYRFSCQVANIDSFYLDHGANSLANLEFRIEHAGNWGGELLSAFKVPAYTDKDQKAEWEYHEATFTAPNISGDIYAHIYILNHNTEAAGNDFAIDDIYFGTRLTTEGSEVEENFKLTVDKEYNVSVPMQVFLCPGQSQEVTPTFTDYNGNPTVAPPCTNCYDWRWIDENSGSLTATSSTLTVTPNSTPGDNKIYHLIVDYSNVCMSTNGTLTVTTRSDCGSEETHNYTYTVCKDTPFSLTAIHSGTSTPRWDTGESGATIQVASANYDTKTYTCTIVDGSTTHKEIHTINTTNCTVNDNDAICVLQEHTLTAVTTGNYTYTWELPDGSTEVGRSITITINDIVGGTTAKKYVCTVTKEADPTSNINAPVCAIETHTIGTIQCPSVITHPDQPVCTGEEFELIPTTTADSYIWIQADGSGVRAPSIKDLLNQETTKEYKCLAIKAANNEGAPIFEENMMPNSDFETYQPEDGHYIGFTSSYTFYAPGVDFPTRNGANDDKNGYHRISAETNGNHFLECDGDDYEVNVITITYAAQLRGSIKNGQDYQFAFSAKTIGGSNFANITFNIVLKDEAGNEIKSVPLISHQLIDNPTWQQFGTGQYWTADDDYPQAEIQLINHTKGWGGNDFGIDNIFFQAVYRNENTTDIILAEEYFTIVASECKDEIDWDVEYLRGSTHTLETKVTGVGYKWFDQEGNPVLDENGQPVTTPTLTIVVNAAQKYTCEVDLGLGRTHTEYITVRVYDPILLTHCESDVIVLTPSKEGDYTWYLLNDNGSKTTLTEPAIVNNTIQCNYLEADATNSILCVITNQEGTRDEQWNITVHSNPSFQVEVTGRNVTIDTEQSFTTLLLDNQFEYTETTIKMLNIGEHTLTMTNSYGCQSTQTFEVVPVPIEPMVFFSPNGDGNYDNWLVSGIEFYPEASIQIFDRYHRLLKTLLGEETIAGWDGNYNGHQMPMDDYWYVIMIPENNQRISGHFVLKR